jgi:hypothetical protein
MKAGCYVTSASALLWMLTNPATAIEDPGAQGPYQVAREEYNLGTASLPSYNAAVHASVHYPTLVPDGLPTPRPLAPGGPFPLIVAVHGAFSVCGVYFDNSGQTSPPCFGSYAGFDYIGSALASHGYIFVSIDVEQYQQTQSHQWAYVRQYVELIHHHLGLWRDWNAGATAPFSQPIDFTGGVDMERIGIVGHSQGGEGVVLHYLYNRNQATPFSVKAVLSIAPTNFYGGAIEGLNPASHPERLAEAPVGVILPYCDGQLVFETGAQIFDDMRSYTTAANLETKHTILPMGAGHDYFNSKWVPGVPGWPSDPLDFHNAYHDPNGVPDPYCGLSAPGNQHLTPAQQQGFAKAYVSAFFRRYLGGETKFEGFLTGHVPPPASAQTTDIHFGYQPPSSLRLDVNSMRSEADLSINDLGQAVSSSGLDNYSWCGVWPSGATSCLAETEFGWAEPHSFQMGQDAGFHFGTGQLDLRWSAPQNGVAATYRNQLPVGTNTSSFLQLQFRAGVNFKLSPRNANQDFRVVLTDGAGHTSSVRVGQYSDALFYPPGNWTTEYPGSQGYGYGAAKILLNTVKIPLGAFSGIDLTDVRSIDFVFDQPNSLGSVGGALLLADIAFAGLPGVGDQDKDTVVDIQDNCSTLKNAAPQNCDTDMDGYGNLCDGDFNQDGQVNNVDKAIFLSDFQTGVDHGTGTDMDCSGGVNPTDYNKFLARLNHAPGPSGLDCAGTAGCTP